MHKNRLQNPEIDEMPMYLEIPFYQVRTQAAFVMLKPGIDPDLGVEDDGKLFFLKVDPNHALDMDCSKQKFETTDTVWISTDEMEHQTI